MTNHHSNLDVVWKTRLPVLGLRPRTGSLVFPDHISIRIMVYASPLPHLFFNFSLLFWNCLLWFSTYFDLPGLVNPFLLNSTVLGLMSVSFLVAIEFMNLEASSLSQIFTTNSVWNFISSLISDFSIKNGCAAHFSYKMFDCKNKEGVECFDLQMKIVYDHNHEVSSTGAWNFLGVGKETKEIYFQLFAYKCISFQSFQSYLLINAYSLSKARLVYTAELKAKLGESEFFKESSKRSINPGSGTVFDMWTKYCKRFGSACLNLVNADTIFALSILDCVFLPTETDLCLWIILFYWDPKLSQPLSPALAVLKGNIIMMNQYRSL